MLTFAFRQTKPAFDRSAQQVFQLIDEEMMHIEDELERQASSNIQVIDYLGRYLLETKGKRVRPALLVLSSLSVGNQKDRQGMIRLAAVMEMLHTATLVHDDIIDNADVRRNRASLNARFGNQASVLMGDWLYMSAFETSLEQRSLEVLDVLTRLTRMMTEGELMQLTFIGNTEITEDQYFEVLTRKTAYLFSGCCEIGALLSNASVEERRALRDYGMDLGIAFQLADDTFDFTSDEKTIGKAAGTDILEGKMTLPLIRLIDADPSARAMLEEIMDKGSYSDGTRAGIARLLRKHSILDKTREVACEYGERARKSLEVLPETRYRSALEAIPDFVIRRSK